jgi:hypothetical protein
MLPQKCARPAPAATGNRPLSMSCFGRLDVEILPSFPSSAQLRPGASRSTIAAAGLPACERERRAFPPTQTSPRVTSTSLRLRCLERAP